MMAEKPDKFPDWAIEEQIDPVSGQFNRVEPPEFRKESGWSRREIPPRQWLNWRAWVSGQWIRWIVPILEGLGTASTQDDDRYAHRANNLSDVASAETSRDNLDVYSRSEADESLSVITNRNINTANGINGGGDLSEDRTLSVDATVVRTTRQINSGRGLSGGGNLSQNRTISTYRTTTTKTSVGVDSISSGFDRIYIFSASNGDYSLTIEQQQEDEGATETVLICRDTSVNNLQINAGTGITISWSFDESISASGYQIKPGEIVRLVKVAADSYVAYADNGISEIVTAGGDFDGTDNLVCARVGGQVTITSTAALSHPSGSIRSSVSGAIPVAFMPQRVQDNVYTMLSDGMYRTSITTGGTVITEYRNFSGALNDRTNSGSSITITYNV